MGSCRDSPSAQRESGSETILGQRLSMLPAQKRNGLPKRKSATRTKISGPGPISRVIMVPRTEIPAVFSGDFGPAGVIGLSDSRTE